MNAEPGQITGTPREEEYAISIKELLQVLLRRWWVILLTALLFAGVAAGYSLTQTPMYMGSIKILVGQQQQSGDVPSQLGSDVMGLQQLTLTVARAVDTRPVAEAAAEELGGDITSGAILANLSAQQVETTQFIQVSYQHPNPETAQQVVNTVGEVFSDQVSEVSTSANSITATVWEESTLPTTPVSPQPVRNGLLALLLGALIGVGLAFLLEQLDDSWRSPEEVEQVSGVPTYGVIPAFKASKARKGEK